MIMIDTEYIIIIGHVNLIAQTVSLSAHNAWSKGPACLPTSSHHVIDSVRSTVVSIIMIEGNEEIINTSSARHACDTCGYVSYACV